VVSISKRILSGFISTFAWLILAIALIVTSANLIVSNLSHAGVAAAGIVKELSADPATFNSLIDQFIKGADPKLAEEINKNRLQINETISSLASSSEIRELIASTIDQITQAALNGSPSVSIDFSKIANLVAKQVNSSAKETLIKQKDLDNLKPTTIDLSNNSKSITDIKQRLHSALLIWLIWLLLIALNFWLRGSGALRTAGIQLISVGVVGFAIRFAAPMAMDRALNGADMAAFQRKIIPEVFTSLTTPILNLSIALTVGGILAILISVWISQRRSRSPL